MIAFRKVFDRIPPDVAMDEAFVEALVVKRGMQVRYAPDAIVYNTGPDSIRDFVRQRRRNHAGHLYLKSKYGYAVSSIQNTRVAKVALKEVWGVVRLLWTLVLLAVLELWSRLLGWYDSRSRRTGTSCGTWRGRRRPTWKRSAPKTQPKMTAGLLQ